MVHHVSTEQASALYGPMGQYAEVLAVITMEGELIEFAEGFPGHIRDGHIEGYVADPVEVTLGKSQINRTIRDASGRTVSVWTKDRKKYLVDRITTETADSLFFLTVKHEPVSIPLSEADMVSVRRIDEAGSMATVVGGALVVVVAMFAIAAATKESCPFVYSFDGEEYIFDAEPYGGATCEGLKRTEWCALEHLREIDGAFRIRLTNEVYETQYTDELKLVVVDHPDDVQMVPDAEGTFVSFPQVIPPMKAYDGTGRDIMRYVATNDWIFWESKVADHLTGAAPPLREELTFHFPKPPDAQSVKVLVNACNTLWGSQMVKRVLELHGGQADEWYRQIEARGSAYDALRQWGLREECFVLHARVKTTGGWKPRELLLGGGPFASEDKAYKLDISDVPGDTLTLRLTPPPLFWMINFIGVDYSDGDVPIQVTELAAEEAVDHDGKDVRELLAATDGRYLSMPTVGERAELVFAAPERQPGTARTVFVKASGYYDIHLDGEGAPNLDVLNRIAAEPGYVATFALEEYRTWRASLMAAR
jgi:hypothetical protein